MHVKSGHDMARQLNPVQFGRYSFGSRAPLPADPRGAVIQTRKNNTSQIGQGLFKLICILLEIICCIVYSFSAFSKPIPVLTEFTQDNSNLLSDNVAALARGALRVSTDKGGSLARRGTDGHWQTYTYFSTKGGLPSDHVTALARGADGALWVGTYGGLARLDKE
jgi:hypothetical protein